MQDERQPQNASDDDVDSDAKLAIDDDDVTRRTKFASTKRAGATPAARKLEYATHATKKAV